MARSPVHEKGNAWLTFCQVVMYPMVALLGRERVSGAEHARRRGGYLLVANHISHLDPLFDSVAVRKLGRIPRFMAKASLWKVPVLGQALANTEQIPVDRAGAGAGQASLDAATAALERGKVVLIYPDGTVTRDPDMWPMKPRMGVGALALSGDFPVIPVAHWGSNQVYASYQEGRRFHPLPRKEVHTRFGEPVDLDDLRAGPHDARAVRAASFRIMTAVRDMVGELRGVTPPDEFYDQRKAERLAQRAAQAQAAAPTQTQAPAPSPGQTQAAAPSPAQAQVPAPAAAPAPETPEQ